MKLVFLSDTHNQHQKLTRQIPLGDVLVHCGDFTNRGTAIEVLSFLEWYGNLPHKHKIFIAGNHDFFFEDITKDTIESVLPNNVIYLENSGIEINGINFWGSPSQPIFFDWAFNKTHEELKKTWSKIPVDTDVLITHCPPHQILDKTNNGLNVGCKALKERLEIINPKINVFGHIHEAYGIEKQNETTFINASIVDENYKLETPCVVLEFEDCINS